MRPTTLLGVLVGAAVLVVGGVAVARPKQHSDPFFVYVVQEGDTLSALALKFFGDAQRWPVLHMAMPKLPDDAQQALPVGAKIHVPCTWTIVEKNESLAAVAKRTLGDAGRWRRLYEANRSAIGPDPNKVGAGQRLAVPVDPASATPLVAVGTELDLLDADLMEANP